MGAAWSYDSPLSIRVRRAEVVADGPLMGAFDIYGLGRAGLSSDCALIDGGGNRN